MQPNYGVGRVAPAGQMILEDHLKKCLSMTSGTQWKPYHNKNLPPVAHSAFGDFPKDYMKDKALGVTDVKPIDKMEVSIAASGTAILKKGDGLGGKTVSLNKTRCAVFQNKCLLAVAASLFSRDYCFGVPVRIKT